MMTTRHALLLCSSLAVIACGDDDVALQDAGGMSDIVIRDDIWVPPEDAGLDTSSDAIAATTFDECTADMEIPIDRSFEPDRFFQLQDFESEELGLTMRMGLSPGMLNLSIGLAINYKSRAFALETPDGFFCVTDESMLDYEVTLHNDNDIFTANVGPDDRYVVTMVYDFDNSTFTDTLMIEHPESGDAPDGPFVLTQAGCSVHREDGISDCTYQVRTPR